MINGLINKDRYDRDGRQINIKCKYTINNRWQLNRKRQYDKVIDDW